MTEKHYKLNNPTRKSPSVITFGDFQWLVDKYKLSYTMKKNICAASKLLILYPLFVSLAFAGDSARIVSGANKLYNAGKYDLALKVYNEALLSSPDSYAINYNLGTAYFKKSEYEKAINSFEKALISSDKSLESKANYNIGNSKYKLGKLKENTDLSNTVKLLRESLDYYKRAIELDSNDKDAKLNHELVEKELKILLDKLKQQQENKDKQKEQNEKQEQKDKQQTENKGENQSQGQKEQQDKTEEAQKNEQKQAQEKETQMNKTQEGNKEQEAGTNQTASMQEDSQEMSADEAKMLLDGYRQEENAKGEIKDTTRGYPAEVLKDW